MRSACKLALVTGASSGMGAEAARLHAPGGARVFNSQRRPTGFADIAADLDDPAAPEHIMQSEADVAGQLDILANCTGIMREGKVEETTAEPLLRAAKGAIVNVGSIEVIGINPRHPCCGASTAGLPGLTRAADADHGPEGVCCNAVAPGWIDTPHNVDYIAGLGDPAASRTATGTIQPSGRTGAPIEICWLASDEAGFVTGQVWTIDGGRINRSSLP